MNECTDYIVDDVVVCVNYVGLDQITFVGY